MARPSKYAECVKPHIDKIKEWVSSGATDKEIADALGIAVSTLCEYKNKHKELSEAFARGRQNVVLDIKAALLKKALGFYYDETDSYIKEDKDGNETTNTRILHRYCPPSETAAAMLLRNYTDDWKDRDNITVKLREQEQRLKEKIAKSNYFDIDI